MSLSRTESVLWKVFALSSTVWILAAGVDHLPFLELDNPTFLPKGTNMASSQIVIPGGIQFGDITQYRAFVTTNGYFTFGRGFLACCPRFFHSGNFSVASYWAFTDTTIAGDVSYQVFTATDHPELLEHVDAFISTELDTSFKSNWLLVANWSGVASFEGVPAVTNTFQGLVVTNGPTSYAVFTYKCGLLEWSGDAVIGFRSLGDHFSIHPLSGSSAQLIACENTSVSNWTNVIYRLDIKHEEVEQCEVDDNLNVTREMAEQYGRCVPYTRIPSRENPCDPLYREGIDYVFVPFRRALGNITLLSNNIADTNVVADLISDDCREPARRILCYFYYPPCGNSTMFEPPREICSDTCFFLRDGPCSMEFDLIIQHTNNIIEFITALGLNFIDCNNTGAFIDPLPHCCSSAGLEAMTVFTSQSPNTTMQSSNSRSRALVAGATGGTVGLIVIVAVVTTLLAVKYRWGYKSFAVKGVSASPSTDISGHDPNDPLSRNFPTARYFNDGHLLMPKPPQLSASREAKVKSVYLRQMSEANLLIPGRQIQLQDCIGKGEFGVVYRAHLIGWGDSTTPELVAVKTLKGAFSLKDVNALMEESLKMKALRHPHILNLIGVSIDAGESPYIIMPYMANGSLLLYLRKERPNLTIAEGASADLIIPARKTLLSICLQIAKGMAYLAGQKFVHRDLAARNCMIDANFVIKVADFGLSEDIYARNYFRQQIKDENDIKLPVRWMALESLQDGKFSEKTDVWSFGVTCWEVFSLGKSPYPGVDPFAVVRFLESGQRLEKSLNAACSDDIYDVILQCWEEHADKRPSFRDLVMKVSMLLEEIAGYIDFSSMSNHDKNGGYDCLTKTYHGYDYLAETIAKNIN